MLRSVAAFAAVLTAVAAASPGPTPRGAAPGRPTAERGRAAMKAESGLLFRISEGTDAAEPAPDAAARPPAEALTGADLERLLRRLPPMAAVPQTAPFAKREDSLPAPRTGRTIPAAFPPAEDRTAGEPPVAGPLSVLRRAPEGEVPLAPHLSITFSQPMVAVSSHAELAQVPPPARLEPPVDGAWRWVGTRTLLFEPEGRFPMATQFRVEIPAGARSATGGALAAGTVWAFSTPPVRLIARHPENVPTRPDALLFAAFDQRVDPAALLGSVRVKAGAITVPVRLVPEEEWRSDETVARLAKTAQPGRFIVFRAERVLPSDTPVSVTIARGAPSAEGPRRTAADQSWSFRTYGPFRITGHECGWGGRCLPFQPWRVELTNPIDLATLRKERIRVEPELPGLKVQGWGSSLSITGLTRGRTTYRVTLSEEIQDAFGQGLDPADPLTFAVGPAEPMLSSQLGDLVVLDPSGPRSVPVYSVNLPSLRVRAYAVGPEHWGAWNEYRERAWREDAGVPPGRLVIDASLKPAGASDELTETRIDLSPALVEGLGQVALVVEPSVRSRERRRQLAVRSWVQSTRIGLDAFSDGQTLLAWANRLEDGLALAEATASLLPGATARTDATGLARLPLADTVAPLLVARAGRDLAILPSSTSWWRGSGWRRSLDTDRLAFFVFDDRGLYRPGEQVRLKGYLRRRGAGPRGDIEALPPGIDSLDWSLRDSRGNEVGKGQARIGGTGGFDLTLDLPPTMNLGDAVVQLGVPASPLSGGTHAHRLQVQEFRRPEFEVSARTTSEGPFVVGGQATVEVKAAYYAGGALPGAEVSWRVESRVASFQPPNRDDFVFGSFVPWWERSTAATTPQRVQSLQALTDGGGRHLLRVDFDDSRPPRPHHLKAEATVMDVNRQAWTGSTQLLVHPALDYVGLRAERPFVQKGEPIAVELIVADLDGHAVVGRSVTLHAERLDWEQVDGVWTEVPKDGQDRGATSSRDPVRVRFEAKEGGVFRIVARIEDQAGRPNESELRVWVAGGTPSPRRELEEEKVTLVPDRREYAGGDTARLLVMAPFAPAEGLLTLRRSGLLEERRFTLPSGSTTLEIPIEDAHVPGLHVQVDLVGAAQREAGETARTAPPRPAFASGSLELAVPPGSRTLALSVKPRAAAVEPGGSTTLDLTVRDAAGRPVAGGEATVFVVDEAVLALSGYRLPDPLSAFYARRDAGVQDHRLRERVLLARLDELDLGAEGGVAAGLGDAVAEMEPQEMMRTSAMPSPAAPMMRMKAGAAPAQPEEAAPIRARVDFAALALFSASVATDAQGRVQLPVKLPDNLTRYRVMAVATAGARQFGSAEATLTARLPLMVRPSAPRFLNFGDRFELPVVVQNQTDAPLTVDVAVRASNLALTAGAGRRVLVPANDRAEVRFPMAAELAGRARIQVGAAAGRAADAAEVELPVWTPATSEAFATYGEIDQGAIVQPVTAPGGVVPQYGGLEITTSSTALQALTDAVLYLAVYPFECAEQLSSRVLAVAALRDVLTAFSAEGLPTPEEMQSAMKRDLERLRGLQNADGGFGFWRRGEASWPYVSIHVAHALARARAKGYEVPQPMLDASSRYLREIDRHIPGDYPPEVKRTLAAYALSVRALLGDADPGRARALVREAGVADLSFEALGFVLPVLSKDAASGAEVAAIRRRLANAVDETAAAAHFAVAYGDGAYLLLHSDRRADAILLEALIADQPKSDLIPKLVAGLLAHRKAGRWTNTQENVFVLLALDRYFQAYEKTTPDFVARAWLGDRYAGEQAFRGRSTDRQHVAIPMSTVLEGDRTQRLLLSKEGAGRLYYRIGLRYAPQDLALDPLDRGFTVERSYEAVDDPKDVRRDADGTWRVRAGARVRVRLTLVAQARRYHVALVDPLPAGFEALNPALAVTGTVPGNDGSDVAVIGAPGLGGPRLRGHWWWWSRPWFEHQNLRDERAEAFSSLLWEGVHTYRYVARATTPGVFVVPPTKAEEMYTPETFGRGGTDRVIVE